MANEKRNPYRESFESPNLSISVGILYTSNKKENPGVIFYPKSQTPSMHSLLIIKSWHSASYYINKLERKSNRTKPIPERTFENLYLNQWIIENKYALAELDAIKQAKEAHIENIEKHLGVRL